MADKENKVDSDSASKGNLSPQSSESCSLPNTPISLDFDPMSFKLKESSPVLSPTDGKITNGISGPTNSIQKVPLDLDYYENLNTASQDRPLIDGLGNQPDIISSSVLKGQEIIDFQDSGPHSPTGDLLQVSASTIASESNNAVLTESSITYSEAEDKQCVITTVTTESTSKHSSLIQLSDEESQEQECILHDVSHQHESTAIDRSDDNFCLSSSVTAESTPVDYSNQENLLLEITENISEEEEMKKQEFKVTKKVKSTVESSYVEVNGKVENPLNSRNAEFSDDEESIECPVSVARLRSQYVHHAEQGISQSPPKEVIDTGIDFESLKISYTQHAQDQRAVSPSREVIATGVNIKSLQSSCFKSQTDVGPKEQEVIETGISVKSLKSSFNQAQDYQSAPIEEVKLSIDKDQLTRKFSQDTNLSLTSQDQHGTSKEDVTSLCKICKKHVYQMEKIFAEKSAFHKSCFRCKECGKSLNVDTYFSHEGEIFCNPHFKLLFQPKARFEDDSEPISKTEDELDFAKGEIKKTELVISESTPAELPPDVVRSDSKAADGLEKIPDLSNIRSWFETPHEEQQQHSVSDICSLQRSESVLARMAKYQSAVSGEQENGHVSTSEDEVDVDISVSKTKTKEKVVFSEMTNLKTQWESASVTTTKSEKVEEQKELTKFRKHGPSGRVKNIYEKACQDASKVSTPRTEPEIEVGEDISAKVIKEKFEKGVVVSNDVELEKQEKVRKEKKEDLNVFSEGAAHDARNLFKQIDAAGAKVPLPSSKSPNKSPGSEIRRTREIQYCSPTSPLAESEVVKCSTEISKQEIVESVEVSERFKFFENYKEVSKETKKCHTTVTSEVVKDDTVEKEVICDPNIIRSSDVVNDIPVTDTARRMLDKFKALESNIPDNVTPVAPKAVRRITPPRDFGKTADSSPNHEPERDPNIVKASYRCDDDIIIEADKAKSLKAKFENWESEVIRENRRNDDEDHLPQADITKNLKAKFESIKTETSSTEKPKSKINRFIQEQSAASMELCDICGRRLYPMEKMETSGQKLHKNCFRCAHCSCILRRHGETQEEPMPVFMSDVFFNNDKSFGFLTNDQPPSMRLRLENYTTSGGKLYCTPHFKQLFISRGNYDEGFGREQHKDKWNRSRSNTPVLRDLNQNGDSSEYTNGDTKPLLQGNFDQQVMA